MNICCEVNDDFEFDRRVNDSCGLDFEFTSDDIYQILCIDYFGESMEQFYTICPRCGYIVPLDANMLNDYEKELARRKSREDKLLYLKNNILSEYTNVLKMGKTRTKTL